MKNKEYMATEELIEKLDQRYGNPLAKDCELIQEAIEHLRSFDNLVNQPTIKNDRK